MERIVRRVILSEHGISSYKMPGPIKLLSVQLMAGHMIAWVEGANEGPEEAIRFMMVRSNCAFIFAPEFTYAGTFVYGYDELHAYYEIQKRQPVPLEVVPIRERMPSHHDLGGSD